MRPQVLHIPRGEKWSPRGRGPAPHSRRLQVHWLFHASARLVHQKRGQAEQFVDQSLVDEITGVCREIQRELGLQWLR